LSDASVSKDWLVWTAQSLHCAASI
jgi:hypothetical protein